MIIWKQLTRDERLEAIRSVWQPGITSTEIGRQLHVSRGAIIGMYTRYADQLKDTALTSRGTRPAGKSVAKRRMVNGSPTMVTPELSPVGPVEPLLIGIMDLSNATCRWPYDGGYCGHDTGLKPPYCPYHRCLAYRPARVRGELVQKPLLAGFLKA